MEIYLTAELLPRNTTISFSPNPIELTGGTTSGTATMLVSPSDATLPGPHSFSVIARDGGSHNALTNTGTLNVTLCSPGIAPMSDGGMCFAFASIPGQNYQIQATTNFYSRSWAILCTTNAGTNNLMLFIDRDATVYPTRFYRALAQ
jgi:hypothetical protein